MARVLPFTVKALTRFALKLCPDLAVAELSVELVRTVRCVPAGMVSAVATSVSISHSEAILNFLPSIILLEDWDVRIGSDAMRRINDS